MAYDSPGIYVEEKSGGTIPIQAVGTSTAGFVGTAPNPKAKVNETVAISNWSQFRKVFVNDASSSTPLSHAVHGFFLNGGGRCHVVNVGSNGPITGNRVGLDLLKQIDEISIVAVPGTTDAASYDALLTHCEQMKDRVAILDGPATVTNIESLTKVATAGGSSKQKRRSGSEESEESTPADTNAGHRPRQSDSGCGAFYFPWLLVRDPLGSSPDPVEAPPSGHLAGIYARVDARRGVHKAPANEAVRGALNLTQRLTHEEQGVLNPMGVNCIRFFAREGIRVWGARTVAAGASEWRYLNVRRLFNMIEESIAQSTRWTVFEPNDQSLWKSIRHNISSFLTVLWRQGALMGNTPEEAFFVQCDEETNPPEEIDAGKVITVIGIAPVKPAEFVIFQISQGAGGAQVDQM